MKVSVSILSIKEKLYEKIKMLNNTSMDYLHLDIMDGSFTLNSSYSILESEKIKELTNKKLDVHIMSKNLDTIIDEYIMLKPYNITFHIENENVKEYINKIKENNIKVGLAINPETDIKLVLPYLNDIDRILIMSVNPGMGGQKFIMDSINKLIKLNEIKDKYNFEIEIDGGINSDTIKYVKDYVDIVVSGSYITNSDDYEKNISELRKR